MEAIFYLAPVAFFFAGGVKGAIGLGLPTMVIAVLSQFVDPRLAVAVGLVPIIFANFWQVYREGEWKRTLVRFWPFSVTLAIVLFFSSNLAADAPAETIILVTGLGVVAFAGASLIRHPPELPSRWEIAAQICAGAAGGVMGGFTGLWAPPLVILLLSLRLSKADFVRATGLLLFLGGLPMFAGYTVNGLITREIFLWSVAMCVPTYLGFAIGERIRRRMGSTRFQKAVLVFFLLAGLNMIRRGLEG
ncbi:MAG: sulfite exporter TauE/SafE family protein [Paracoccaceae bacterium]